MVITSEHMNLTTHWKGMRMPTPLKARLNELLDKQDGGLRLSVKERKEAEALVELSDILSLVRIESLRKENGNR